jgi:hypothetical protein
MESFTITEAARLLDGQITREALRKRVQRPGSPGGLRSVLSADGKRRIPRAELERVGLRLTPIEDNAAEIVRQLAEKIAHQERELTRLRALPERVAIEAQAREDAQAKLTELEAWRLDVVASSWRRRRRLLKDAAS